jgi:hydrogenase expression/formation protein HypC
MCLAYPGKIILIDGQRATADFDGVRKEINISLVPEVKEGEFVIVHAGFAIQILSKEDAFDVMGEYEKVKN